MAFTTGAVSSTSVTLIVTFTGAEVLLAASLAVIPNVNVFGVVSKSLDAADAAAPAAVRVITPLLLMAKNPELFPDAIAKLVTPTASVAVTVPTWKLAVFPSA